MDGPVNGDAFLVHVKMLLVPTFSRGDIVITDNLGNHKTEAVRAAVRGAGARLLFLPPCSPDLNPIEQVFAKLKHYLRKDQPRTRDGLWKNVGSILKKFGPKNARTILRAQDMQFLKLSEKALSGNVQKLIRDGEWLTETSF